MVGRERRSYDVVTSFDLTTFTAKEMGDRVVCVCVCVYVCVSPLASSTLHLMLLTLLTLSAANSTVSNLRLWQGEGEVEEGEEKV